MDQAVPPKVVSVSATAARTQHAPGLLWSRRLTAALYLGGALFILTPLVDGIAVSWPFRPGAASWRYGTVGVFANYLISPLLGALLLTVVAAVRRHGRALRVLGVLWGISAGVLLLLGGAFVLDVLELRSQVPAQRLNVFDIGAAKALAKYLSTAVAFGVLAAAALPKRKSEG